MLGTCLGNVCDRFGCCCACFENAGKCFRFFFHICFLEMFGNILEICWGFFWEHVWDFFFGNVGNLWEMRGKCLGNLFFLCLLFFIVFLCSV